MVAKKRRKFKKKVISQALHFQMAQETFENTKLKYKKGKWYLQLSLQPTPFSPFYQIEICKGLYGNFEAWLIGGIKKIDDISFPHIYRIDKTNQRVQLCLYHPKKYEWNKLQTIHTTIIPWVSDWLYYYELWLDDAVWRGGGEHP
ncbi:hypothetical protein [Carnobacterium maltaromaticum]|uniref:hypothetical protein n=1 Tax=Carnobacterium maltaromaticum TaxID=2751 RepID=UPI0039BEA468